MEILAVPYEYRNNIQPTKEYLAADRCLVEAERIAMRGYRDKPMRKLWGEIWASATVRLLDGGLLLVQRTEECFEYQHNATRVVGEETPLSRDEALALLMRGLGK